MMKCRINLSSIRRCLQQTGNGDNLEKLIFDMLESFAEWKHFQIKDKTPPKLDSSK